MIISTYNGSKNIIRQLDSIFGQEGVAVSVHIRDDNSQDNTVEVVKEYARLHSQYTIVITSGQNMGYAKSFWTALEESENADYYAFSDQDDVWLPNKLIKSISMMDKERMSIPQLSYCKMVRSDEVLRPLKEQVSIIPNNQLTKKLTLTKTFSYGAAIVINGAAKDLICRCWPDVSDLPHDLWAGMLCFWFGRVHYIDENLYYWIRYDSSVTGAGTKKSGRIYRIKQALKGKSYVNVAPDLIQNYNDLLTREDLKFLNKIVNYKSNLFDRISLLLDKEFRRDSTLGTIMLKVGVALGWY